MKRKTLGCWAMASGNVAEVLATIGGGDFPRVLSVRCEWAWRPSAGDVAEYRREVQPQLAALLAKYAAGSVVLM